MIRLSPDGIARADMLLLRLIAEVIRSQAGDAVAVHAVADLACCILVGGGPEMRVFWEEQLARASREVSERTDLRAGCGS